MNSYLSPECAAEIIAMEATVKAKLKAGYAINRSLVASTKAARLEWIVNAAAHSRETSVCCSPRLHERPCNTLADADGEPQELFESLWAYCTGNKRLFPKDWGTLYYLLSNKTRSAPGKWQPSPPLTVTDWFCIYATPVKEQMQLRFKEHVEWARDHGQLTEVGSYLRSLAEDEWFHFGDL